MGHLADLGTMTIVVLSALLVGGYALGNWINRKHLQRQSLWLREAFQHRGAEARFKSLGAFGVVAMAEFPSDPVRRAEVTIQLVLRDVAPIWLWRRLQHMPDSLTFRLVLERTPGCQGDIVDSMVPIGRRAIRAIPAAWTRDDGRIVRAAPDDTQLAEIRRLGGGLAQINTWIVSIRRSTPHLLVTVPTPEDPQSLAALVDALWKLAEPLTNGQVKSGSRTKDRRSRASR